MQSDSEVIRDIFRQLKFPYLASDLAALPNYAHQFDTDPRSYFSVEITPAAERGEFFVAAMRGMLIDLDVPEPAANLHYHTALARDPTLDPSLLRRAMSCNGATFAVYEKDNCLVWEETTPWPAIYGDFLGQLVSIVDASKLRIEAKRGAAIGLIIDQVSRTMPTRFHYAASSFGAWLGGALNFQYLSHFATQPQMRERSVNRAYARRIGFSDDEAAQLDESGLIAVPAWLAWPLLKLQGGDIPILGATPLDEWNIANLPALDPLTAAPPEVQPTLASKAGVIADKNYRQFFWARAPAEQALYGAANVLRDHYQDFYAETSSSGLLRCKHYCVPIIDVGSVHELLSIAERIPPRGEGELLFRGQSSLYLLNRTAQVKRMLFGNSCADEPSLVTSASRTNFDYDSLHFLLRYFLQNYQLSVAASHGTYSRDCQFDYAVMALAQHYGLPSHGLDVTSDVEVATWFATHRFSRDPSTKVASYTPLSPGDWPNDISRWPVVFALQVVTHSLGGSVQDCQHLHDRGLHALRPCRQRAKFFMGGHADHQNRLAEAVVCAFRLRPGSYSTSCSFEDLFPPSSEDPGYQAMIDFEDSPPFNGANQWSVTRFANG